MRHCRSTHQLFTMVFDIGKKRLEELIERYIVCPIRRKQEPIGKFICAIKNCCVNHINVYLLRPVNTVSNSYVIPCYRKLYNLVKNIYWCVSNSRQILCNLFDVLGVIIQTCMDKFRHLFAVLL